MVVFKTAKAAGGEEKTKGSKNRRQERETREEIPHVTRDIRQDRKLFKNRRQERDERGNIPGNKRHKNKTEEGCSVIKNRRQDRETREEISQVTRGIRKDRRKLFSDERFCVTHQ